MRGGDTDNIRRLLNEKARFINGVSRRCAVATCGYVLFVRALKLSAHALTYLFLNRADGLCGGRGFALWRGSVLSTAYFCVKMGGGGGTTQKCGGVYKIRAGGQQSTYKTIVWRI